MSPAYSVLDLGSNSFHMIYARVEEDGKITVLDKFKQYVSLGAGLKQNGEIRERYQHAAVNCLREASKVIRRQQPDYFSAVATNAFRCQKDDYFKNLCERALGHPIRVLSSEEEGDYIYRGAVQTTPLSGQDHCILDIGGSSTEFILGSGARASCILSWQLGSAILTERFFDTRTLRPANWQAAVDYADETMTLAGKGRIHLPGIETMYGASGAIRAISNTMIKLGVNDTGTIDAEAVEELVQSLLNIRIGSRFKHLDRYRVQVFLGGLAILHAIFELLDVRDLKPARGAIREGVLLEMHQQALTTAKAA